MMDRWWFSAAMDISTVFAVSWVVWVVGSIVLHELSHGWAAIRLGDDTPRATGHMTWNPLVHMGTASLLAFALIGIAWGQMPVNPSRLRGRYGDALVSAAGPAMNLSLVLLALVLHTLWIGLGGGHWAGPGVSEPLYGNVQTFLRVGIALNLALAAFNLLPVPPLDGSRILSSLYPPFHRMWQGEQAQFLALIAFAGVFFLGGRIIFGSAFTASREMVDWSIAVFVPGAV